ncbi:MAG: hypothetical protein QM676_01380 [Novosphingobium sp.]
MNSTAKTMLCAAAATLSIGSAFAGTGRETTAADRPAAAPASSDSTALVTIFAANQRETNLRKTADAIIVMGAEARDKRR